MATRVLHIAGDRERVEDETSTERFDRVAFAMRAVALMKPASMRVAIAEGGARVVVEQGRAWERPAGAQWAMLCFPPTASRRAITLAAATLAAQAPEPFVLDALLAAPSASDA